MQNSDYQAKLEKLDQILLDLNKLDTDVQEDDGFRSLVEKLLSQLNDDVLNDLRDSSFDDGFSSVFNGKIVKEINKREDEK
jgi:hypothetical protein